MSPETTDWRLPLNAPAGDLDRVGGKALNLMRLYSDGLPVPPGFVLATDAYRAFVAENDLAERIDSSLAAVDPRDASSLETASAQIRAAFSNGQMPADLRSDIEAGYAELGEKAVAVRSSATAEDLPDMSFAGQQDTFLNVRGGSHLLDAVVKCWSSLWTARAIGYRARNQVDHNAVALAVIVQEMVPSEASGVLFTANPLSGKRGEIVIDATLGLGEALVAGEVEPDHYVVRNQGSDPSIEKILGAKAIVIQPDDGGGVTRRPAQAAGQQALPDAAIRELARLGERAAQLLQGPQDVEWAWANGELLLLQSRPITSLFPLPERLPRQPPRVLMSFGAPQGVLDPITPLGRDVIKKLFVNTANRLNFRVELDTQTVLYSAADRLFINITGPLSSLIGRKVLVGFLGIAEPGIVRGLARLQQEGELPEERASVAATLFALVRLLPFLFRLLVQVVLALLAPARSRQQLSARLERERQQLRRQRRRLSSSADHVEYLEQVLKAFPRVVHELMARVAASMLALNILRRMCGERALSLTRGLPHNVTTEMDLALWHAAQSIRGVKATRTHLLETEAHELAEQYLSGNLPAAAQNALRQFLERYGMRGAGEIDLGRPRWRENPTPVLQVLRSYMQIEDRQQAPDAVFAEGASQAEALIDQLAAETGGPVRARLVRWLARRVRELGGLREAPKFFIVSLLGHGRNSMLTVGRQLAERAVLRRAEDVFYVHIAELHALAADGCDAADLREQVLDRRHSFERERRRRQLPRLLLSDGRALYDEAARSSDEDGALVGSPVSPGVVEGKVRVVFDPQRAELEPGEILVCPGTDPGWTPLFLAAGGLVTEVGGLMTHGSVVAREYGIPAVVGVQDATERLRTGQRVRLDGSSGRVELLREAVAD